VSRWLSIVWVLVCIAGCAIPPDDRAHDYNEDGVYLFQRGDYAAARESFQAALALRSEDAGLCFNIAQCYDHMGDTARAERFYEECLRRAPNHAEARHALVELLDRQKRRPEAVRLVQDWMNREPKLATVYAEDGWLCHRIGDLPRAQARLQQALDIDPHDTRALLELGKVYEEMDRPERAIALYERVLQRDPKHVEAVSRINTLRAKGAGQPQPE
jgi:tetratricopeptide (TPR) repeat protein